MEGGEGHEVGESASVTIDSDGRQESRTDHVVGVCGVSHVVGVCGVSGGQQSHHRKQDSGSPYETPCVSAGPALLDEAWVTKPNFLFSVSYQTLARS